nr:C-type natriuretic peptide 1-like [Anolis sagrei ordinatus]
MGPHVTCFRWVALLLILTRQHPAEAKPAPHAQVLEGRMGVPAGSSEAEEGDDGLAWPLAETAAQRVLMVALLGSPQHLPPRSKKGLSRGCFGVKLDRIGALSGLGC